MSEEGKPVEVPPEGQGYEFSDQETPEPEPAKEEPQPLTADVLQAELDKFRKEVQEYADRTAQSASDKRFNKVREEVDKVRELAEAAGVKFTKEQEQAMIAKALYENPNPAGSEAPAEQPSQPAQAPPPPHVIWGIQELQDAGVPENAPEVREINPNDPEFRNKVRAVAQQYRQASTQQPQASTAARMPTPATAGAASGDQLDALRQKVNRMSPTNPEYIKSVRELERLVKQRQQR